ncbi:hypothetical protein BH09ACT8_BH09ACT8_48070 [soil metagenome]
MTRIDDNRPDDVSEADLAEQQTPVGEPADHIDPDLSPLAPTTTTDGNPADLIEQSLSVDPPDDDEEWQR